MFLSLIQRQLPEGYDVRALRPALQIPGPRLCLVPNDLGLSRKVEIIDTIERFTATGNPAELRSRTPADIVITATVEPSQGDATIDGQQDITTTMDVPASPTWPTRLATPNAFLILRPTWCRSLSVAC